MRVSRSMAALTTQEKAGAGNSVPADLSPAPGWGCSLGPLGGRWRRPGHRAAAEGPCLPPVRAHQQCAEPPVGASTPPSSAGSALQHPAAPRSRAARGFQEGIGKAPQQGDEGHGQLSPCAQGTAHRLHPAPRAAGTSRCHAVVGAAVGRMEGHAAGSQSSRSRRHGNSSEHPRESQSEATGTQAQVRTRGTSGLQAGWPKVAWTSPGVLGGRGGQAAWAPQGHAIWLESGALWTFPAPGQVEGGPSPQQGRHPAAVAIARATGGRAGLLQARPSRPVRNLHLFRSPLFKRTES